MTAFLLKLALGGLNLLKLLGSLIGRFFSALDVQGWVGLIASVALAFMWLHAAGEERHWKKQSAQFETLYRNGQAAFAKTVADYRAAVDKARAEDAANKARVESEQHAINERTDHDFQARIADARSRAERVRRGATATDSSRGGTAPVPGVSTPAVGSAQGAGQGGLPADDALTATEQAIQLDEIIKWIRRQHAVDTNGR